jgi:EAL domain-containing protein (putative c-di-GMP-specific phosphodiesterase class I)
MTDPVHAMEILGRLNGMGVQISIDDFGTGHSSMAYLKGLPVDELKMLGCDAIQGYHVSRPLPPADLVLWLHRHAVSA